MNSSLKTRAVRSILRSAASVAVLATVALSSIANADITSPKDISGLTLWLNADAISGVANGGSVATWADGSGNGYDYTKTGEDNQPVYVASGLNGHAVVHFSGAQTLYNSAFNPSTAFTLFAVAKYNDTGSQNTNANNAYFGGGAQRMAFGVYTGTGDSPAPKQSFWAWAPNEWSTYGQAGSVDTKTNVHAYVIAGTDETSWSWYKNGVKTGAAAETAGTPLAYNSGTYVGWSGLGLEAWNGDIAELLVYQGALTESQIGQVNTYLQNKYVATPEPCSIVLFITAVFGLVAYAWRKRR